ncbi:MAG: ATP-binding protein [Planctomycetota bacterium]
MSDASIAVPQFPVTAEELADLPRLFEEFSRVTADLVASHDLLRGEVRRLERELADKNRRLEHKKRLEALGRVAAGVAHEFRNPLGGIRLTVDALLGDRPSDKAQGRLEHVRNAVTHLDHIVEDLLTFTGSTVVEPSPIRAADLLERSIAIAFPEPSAVRERLVVDGDCDLEFCVDRHAMTQVLVNLLVNASQATASTGGRIGAWWGKTESASWIEIADEGPGIPVGEEEKIFHPFHSLRDGGTGLGLSIVHSRIEAHGGEINVVSDSWGDGADFSGARFRIQLPNSPIEEEIR